MIQLFASTAVAAFCLHGCFGCNPFVLHAGFYLCTSTPNIGASAVVFMVSLHQPTTESSTWTNRRAKGAWGSAMKSWFLPWNTDWWDDVWLYKLSTVHCIHCYTGVQIWFKSYRLSLRVFEEHCQVFTIDIILERKLIIFWRKQHNQAFVEVWAIASWLSRKYHERKVDVLCGWCISMMISSGDKLIAW